MDTMLGANLPRDEPDPVITMVPDSWEQVVFRLRRQAESHVVPEVGICREVATFGDLHLGPRPVLPRIWVQDRVGDL